jgi:hypothetical protein
MPGIGRHIPGSALQQIGIFAEQTQRVVATHAQKSADFAGPMVMVDV